MTGKGYTSELETALTRSDAELLIQQIDAFIAHHMTGNPDWPNDQVDDFVAVLDSYLEQDKALAFLALAAARTDDALFLAMMGAGPLEDLLGAPRRDILDRIVAEARKSARFRWLLSVPFKSAVTTEAWEAIKPFRVTGPNEEPRQDTLPPRS